MLFCSKMCFIVLFNLSYNIFVFCLQNHRTWLTDSCLEREYPTAAAFLPGLVFTPADHNVPFGRPRSVSS